MQVYKHRVLMALGLTLTLTIFTAPAFASDPMICILAHGTKDVPLYEKPGGPLIGKVEIMPTWTGAFVNGPAKGAASNPEEILGLANWYSVVENGKTIGFLYQDEGGYKCDISGGF
jgi:hypothetical protein